MATESELRQEIAEERRELTDAVAELREELGQKAERGKKLGVRVGAAAGAAALARRSLVRLRTRRLGPQHRAEAGRRPRRRSTRAPARRPRRSASPRGSRRRAGTRAIACPRRSARRGTRRRPRAREAVLRPPRGSPRGAPRPARPRRPTNARSWRTSGYGLTSSKATHLRRRLGERVEVELERAPDAVEQRRVELAEPALGRARGLAGMEERLGRPLVARLEAERRVDLLDGPLRLGEAAVGDARRRASAPRAARADVAVDARDLEQRDVARRPRRRCARAGSSERRVEERRAQRAASAESGSGSAERRPVGDEASACTTSA